MLSINSDSDGAVNFQARLDRVISSDREQGMEASDTDFFPVNSLNSKVKYAHGCSHETKWLNDDMIDRN